MYVDEFIVYNCVGFYYFFVIYVYIGYEVLCVSFGIVDFGGVFLVVVIVIFNIFISDNLELFVECNFFVIWFLNCYVSYYFLCIGFWVVNFSWVEELCVFLFVSDIDFVIYYRGCELVFRSVYFCVFFLFVGECVVDYDVVVYYWCGMYVWSGIIFWLIFVYKK